MDRNSEQAQGLSHSALENGQFLTENLNRLWSSLIIDEFIKQGIDNFFLSPGMRNAPLLAAVHHNKNAKAHLGVDERAHAYKALGYAKATGKPGVLICTSGTALANYLPAVIESYQSRLPLIIISADRPPELVYSGANQTINQSNIYIDYLAKKVDLGTPTEEITPLALQTTMANLIHSSLAKNAPVHLNMPFRDPLDQTKKAISKSYLHQAESRLSSSKPSSVYTNSHFQSDPLSQQQLENFIRNTSNGLLVVGELPSHIDKRCIEDFAKKLGWSLFLDVTSSLKYQFSLKEKALPTFDHPEVFDKLQENLPDTILHIGGRLTSKHYYRFLEQNPNILLLSLNESHEKEDPSHTVDYRYITNLDLTLSKLEIQSSLSKKSIDWNNLVAKKVEIIENGPFSYPVLSKSLIEQAPAKSSLYLGNSTIIRSFDSYAAIDYKKDLKIITHRGASGIEGFIAASSGYASEIQGPLTLVLGDISFLHDLNSLHYLKEHNHPMVIVVINNQGGGIFKLLPVADEKEVLPYLTTPHDLNFEKAAELFGIKYFCLNNINQFRETYIESIQRPGVTLIEAQVDDQKNIEIYKRLRTVKL